MQNMDARTERAKGHMGVATGLLLSGCKKDPPWTASFAECLFVNTHGTTATDNYPAGPIDDARIASLVTVFVCTYIVSYSRGGEFSHICSLGSS